MSKHSSEPEYIQANNISALVIRSSRRKTATIKVEDGIVSIAVPQELSNERIITVLNNKADWLRQKLALHQQTQPATSKEFVSGEAFPYLGRNYRLKVNTGEYSAIKMVNGRLVATFPTGSTYPYMIRNALLRWYERMAKQKIIQKVKRYAVLIGVEPKSINIKDFKSRWGSCSNEGDIDFHWKIMMAPNRVVDYVVVHELCHLLEHNHSPKFWKHVERILPDYIDQKEWLKVNQGMMEI